MSETRPGLLALLLLAAVFAAFILLGGTAQLLNLGWGLWFSEIFVFTAVPFIALRMLGQPAVSFKALTAKAVLFGLAAGTINYLAAAVPLMSLAEALFSKTILEMFDGSAIFKDRSAAEIALIVAGVSIAAPLCEEYFFRGVFQPRLVEVVGPVRGIFLTAFIFSAFHLDPVGFMARLELGLLFGLLAFKTGSIWPGVFAHAANNLVSSVAYFATKDAEAADIAWYVPVGMALIGTLGLVVLWRFRPTLEAPPPEPRQAPVSPGRALAPWFGAALISLALLLAVDARGVALNLYDAMHPVSKSKSDQLRPLRERARSGDIELREYYELRAQ